MLVCLRAIQGGRRRDFTLAGLLFSATTIVRPAFFLLPFGLAIAMPVLRPSERNRQRIGQWAVLAVAAAITMAPWFTYNYVYLGPLHVVARRRHRPRPVGGIVAGPLARRHAQPT